MNKSYQLSPATQDDFEFLYSLRKATLKEYISQLREWDENWEREYFKDYFNPKYAKVITISKQSIGSLSIISKKHEIILVDIQILPGFQNIGIGTSIIKSIIKSALREKKDIILTVLKVNIKAQKLYKRFGFEIVNENKAQFLMKFYSNKSNSIRI